MAGFPQFGKRSYRPLGPPLTVAAVAAILAPLPAAAQTVTVPTGTSQTISAVITDGTTANTLTVTGGGTLALTSGDNTYSGGTIVTGNSSLQIGLDPNSAPPRVRSASAATARRAHST